MNIEKKSGKRKIFLLRGPLFYNYGNNLFKQCTQSIDKPHEKARSIKIVVSKPLKLLEKNKIKKEYGRLSVLHKVIACLELLNFCGQPGQA